MNINEKSNECDNNVEELLENIIDKINNVEFISEKLVDDIYLKLKLLCIEHNKKINEWYDEKYNNDLKHFLENNNEFSKASLIYENNCFISILM